MPCPLRSRGSGATVAVLISWEPPREGDLPVRNYRVTWMARNTHTTHKHTLHAHTRNNMRTLPSHSRPVEQDRRESNAKVTQGVSNHFINTYVINKSFLLDMFRKCSTLKRILVVFFQKVIFLYVCMLKP